MPGLLFLNVCLLLVWLFVWVLCICFCWFSCFVLIFYILFYYVWLFDFILMMVYVGFCIEWVKRCLYLFVVDYLGVYCVLLCAYVVYLFYVWWFGLVVWFYWMLWIGHDSVVSIICGLVACFGCCLFVDFGFWLLVSLGWYTVVLIFSVLNVDWLFSVFDLVWLDCCIFVLVDILGYYCLLVCLLLSLSLNLFVVCLAAFYLCGFLFGCFELSCLNCWILGFWVLLVLCRCFDLMDFL